MLLYQGFIRPSYDYPGIQVVNAIHNRPETCLKRMFVHYLQRVQFHKHLTQVENSPMLT